jgi:hypothetical protein
MKAKEEGASSDYFAGVGNLLKNRVQNRMQEVGTRVKMAGEKFKIVGNNAPDTSNAKVDMLGKEKLEEAVEIGANDDDNGEKKKFLMTPDDVLQKMLLIGKQKMKGISIQDYYEVAWSEGNDCDKKPLYGPFLTSCGKNDVEVSPWERQEGGEGYKGEWCDEEYTQQRIVTFNFMKKTMGESLVSVKHTQRCRRINDDRCIVHMTLKMDGFPYADCFVGKSDLLVEIGLFVRFIKSCMFEGKIRANTTAETTKAQMDLLGLITKRCAPFAKEVEMTDADDNDEDEIDTNAEESKHIVCDLPIIRFLITLGAKIFFWPFMRLDLFDPFPPTSVDEALTNVRRRLVLLERMSLERVMDDEQKKDSLAKEMIAIKASLHNIEAIASSSKGESP